jgi:hypothetical protein
MASGSTVTVVDMTLRLSAARTLSSPNQGEPQPVRSG